MQPCELERVHASLSSTLKRGAPTILRMPRRSTDKAVELEEFLVLERTKVVCVSIPGY